METTNHFNTFEDLELYKSARGFRRLMYGVSRKLPQFENPFNLFNSFNSFNHITIP